MSDKIETMTRAMLSESMKDSFPQLSSRESVDVVNTIISVLHDTLASGENIKISGFGRFSLKDKKARIGRNPQTGEAIEISARRVLGFKASDSLKGELKGEVQ